MTKLIDRWRRDQGGASAAEMGLLLVPLTLLIFGIFHLCLMTWAQNQLNFAAEATARCMVVASNAQTASVTAPACTTSTTRLSYLQARYNGATAAPTFATGYPVLQQCNASGNYQVVAQTNYVMNMGFLNLTVPLTAKACFAY